MNKINKLGMQLLDYKIELVKDYPTIVIDSLKNSVKEIIDENNLDDKIRTDLYNKLVSKSNFTTMLLSNKIFLKTEEELYSEYEVLKSKLEKHLNNFQLSYSPDFENDCVIITKSFLISQDFIKQYFYIEDEKSFEILIKRKGFIEKFAILRLKRIMEDFVSKEISNGNDLELNSSDIFFDSTTNLYGINLNINIKFENIEDEELFSETIEQVIGTINNSDEFYLSRMKV